MRNRRTKEGYRLRVYMDEIKALKAMTNAEWNDRWVASATKDSLYTTRESMICYLEASVMSEVNSLLRKEAA